MLAMEAVALPVVMYTISSKAQRAIIDKSGMPSAARKSEDTESRDALSLLQVYQTRTIVSAAMFEGLAFFATIAYLVEGNPISLGVAVAMILGVAAHFPTPGRIIGWVDRQLEAVEVEKITP
jgi:hypothetical protein